MSNFYPIQVPRAPEITPKWPMVGYYYDADSGEVDRVTSGILRDHLKWSKGNYTLFVNMSEWENIYALFVYDRTKTKTDIHHCGSNWILI